MNRHSSSLRHARFEHPAVEQWRKQHEYFRYDGPKCTTTVTETKDLNEQALKTKKKLKLMFEHVVQRYKQHSERNEKEKKL